MLKNGKIVKYESIPFSGCCDGVMEYKHEYVFKLLKYI